MNNNIFEENAKEWRLIEHEVIVTYLVLSIDANDKNKSSHLNHYMLYVFYKIS